MAGTKWVATVTDQQWLVAKIRVRNYKTKILKLKFFALKDERQEETASPDALQFSIAPDFSEQSAEDTKKRIAEAGQELKNLFKRKRIPTKKLGLSISCPGVITRIVTVPVMKKKLLDQLFTEQVEQYFTFNVVDYIIDYKVLAKVEEDGQKRFKVLLAAMPREVWYWHWQVLQEANVNPKVIDLQFECLTRLYSHLNRQAEGKIKNNKRKTDKNSGETPETEKSFSDIAIVDLSEDRAEMIILEHGEFFLYSDVNINNSGLNELLWNQKQVSDKASEIIQDSNELLNEDPEISLDESGSDALRTVDDTNENNDLTQLENLLFPVMQNLSEFMNFFAAKHFGKNVDAIYITGKYAMIKGVAEVFKTNLEIDTKIGYPGDWQPKFSRKTARLKIDARSLGTIIGLALRED